MEVRSRHTKQKKVSPFTNQLNKEQSVAMEIAKVAGAMMRADFKRGMEVKIKGDGTPVTKTDTRINEMVIEKIRKEFPSHDIFAEERSDSKKSTHRWICDPLDGTEVFSHGIPTFVFSLALVVDGVPKLGFVYHPITDAMFSAEVGKGAFLNGERIRVSGRRDLKDSMVGMAYWPNAQFKLGPACERIADVGGSVTRLGSITYMGALVSCGELVANIHPAKSPWDSTALKVIIPEADGKITDLFGDDQPYDGSFPLKGCIMSNGVVHEALVRLVRG
jgi:myo-inositol-1(or 4)-monophosphatase